MIERLKEVEEEITQAIRKTLEDNKAIILDMNTEDQLFDRGVTREGVPIERYAPYRPFTISVKRAKGQPTSRVTLRDSGDFHESFFINFDNDSFEIKASDEKTEKLKFQYGAEIMGLTKENMQDLSENYIKPVVREILSKI